jgi:hypothetical protein
MTAGGGTGALPRGYVKLRKFLKFRRLKRILRFKALAITRQGPPAYAQPGSSRSAWVDPDAVMMAIRVTGGLGDFVVVARFIRDLCQYAANLKIHVFCPAEAVAGAWVFAAVPQIEAVYNESFFFHVHQNYDCSLVAHQMAFYYGEHADYDKIRSLSPNLLKVLSALNKSRPQWDVFIHHHPFLDGAMAHTAVALGESRNTLLHSMSGLKPGGDILPLKLDETICDGIRATHARWLTINNGFDANFAIGGAPATKCYPQHHWNTLVGLLKKAHPDIAIVQIGAKTSRLVPGADVDLIGKTSLPQVAAVIRGGMLHIDIEGGLVHVAASVGRRSAVFFGPTSVKYFSYADNLNLSSGFCGNCWWTKRTWMEACPREFDSALCMEHLDPRVAVAAIVKELDGVERVVPPSPELNPAFAREAFGAR